MATPPRLVQLRCPRCEAHHWTIDTDYRHAGDQQTYFEREYHCPHCRSRHTGFRTGYLSPPSFFMQPNWTSPMTQRTFDAWVNILRRHFPEHPWLAAVGRTWYPSLPGPVNRFWYQVGRRFGPRNATTLRWTVRLLVLGLVIRALGPYLLRITRSGQIMLAVILVGSFVFGWLFTERAGSELLPSD